MKCSACENEIRKDKHCVVWELPMVRFICISCSESKKYKEVDPTKDASNEKVQEDL